MTERILITDALSAGSGKRRSSRDSIGCGPRAIAGVLEKAGLGCRIQRVETLLKFPKSVRNYDHLAISAMTMDYPVVFQTISLWRRSKPRGKILLGGPIASDSERVLMALKPDILVVGEGEGTLNDLVSQGYPNENIDLSEIHGIGFIHDKAPVLTPQRPLLDQSVLWDTYPPSTTRIIDYPVYEASKVYVETVRGCSNYKRTTLTLPDGRACSECGICDSETLPDRLTCPEDIPPGCGFCSVPAVWGPPRSRPVESILEEVSALLDLGVHRIVLEAPDFLDYMRGPFPMTDPCQPTANLAQITSLLSLIMKLPAFSEGTAHLSIENMKACLFTEDVAQALSDVLDSSSPNIGLETGSEEHSKAIGKCGTPQNVIDAVRLAKHYGMTPYIYFIYGMPGESEQTIAESIEVMKQAHEAGAERIILYGFRPLPRSAFAEFPSPEHRDPLGERLRAEAARINRLRKDDLVGKVLRGIAAEPSWERHGYTMVYPLGEGPIMTVQGGFSPGTLLDIEITHVLSPGLVGGKIISS